MGREIVRRFGEHKLHNSLLNVNSRPKSLNDVTAQDHTITVLQRTLQATNVRTLTLENMTSADQHL